MASLGYKFSSALEMVLYNVPHFCKCKCVCVPAYVCEALFESVDAYICIQVNRMAGLEAPGICVFFPPEHMNCKSTLLHPDFNYGFWISNSGLCTFKSSVLMTKACFSISLTLKIFICSFLALYIDLFIFQKTSTECVITYIQTAVLKLEHIVPEQKHIRKT